MKIEPKPHPAVYNDKFLPVFAEMLHGCTRVLDPFAGTGKIFLLEKYNPELDIYALEIEPEWCAYDSRIVCGNALSLPWSDNFFDAICTSPAYGNRMADSTVVGAKGNVWVTYASRLGRKLNENNGGRFQWGEKYRSFHRKVWKECKRVLCVGGRLVLNIKDHIRNGEVQHVTDWHIRCLEELGFRMVEHRQMGVSSMRRGRNRDARINKESIVLFTLTRK